MGLEINDPCNVLLLVGAAERRFDHMDWTLKPLAPSSFLLDGVQRVMQPYKVLVLNPELLLENSNKQRIVDHPSSKTWADVDGKLLLFDAGDGEPKPHRRACGLHATLALRRAQQQGWLKTPLRKVCWSAADLVVDEAAWASPTFDKDRMDAFLADAAAFLPERSRCSH